MKKNLVRVLALLAFIGAAVLGYRAYVNASKPPEISYRTAKVDRGSVVAKVTSTGTLSAHVTVQVGTQVSGRIAEILVDFNSTVKKGQVIAKIDPELFQAALASARANTYAAEGAVAKSKASLLNAQRSLDRAKASQAEGLTSQADLDLAITAVEVAKADVEAQKGNFEQARANEHQAAVNLAYTTIISPIDGTVISRAIDVGQTVAASLQAPTLFTIAEDLRKMQVDTNVTEGDVGKLSDGMMATFTVDAYPTDKFTGIIRQIRNAATTVQNVVTYDAVIDVENAELKLKPGMTANVTMVNAKRDDVLRVPNSALRFRPPPSVLSSAWPAGSGHHGGRDGGRDGGRGPRGAHSGEAGAAPAGSAAPAGGAAGNDAPSDRRTLWVLRNDQPVRVPVRVGLTDGTLTEIVSGDVADGDQAIVEATGGDEKKNAPAGGQNQPRMRL